jgi:cell division protein FtsW
MSTDILSTITTQTRLRLTRRGEGDPWDLPLLIVVVSLVAFGLVMLYSASAVMAAQKLGDHLYLVKSQLVKVVLGVMMLLGALRVDYRWYKRLIYPILGASVLMLVLVLLLVLPGCRR